MSTRPAPPAEDVEKKKFKESPKDIIARILWWWIPCFWTTVHAVSLLESYVILTTRYPALQSLPAAISSPCSDLTNKVHLTPLSLAAFVLGFVGFYLRTESFSELGRQFTFELSMQQKHKLVTTGPYAIVRHPGYAGSLINFPGVAILFFGPGSLWAECDLWQTTVGKTLGYTWFGLFAIILPLFVWRVPKEDAALREEFKDEWKAWAQKTRYKLLPGIY
ncbi:hypothetical protein K474DRAFT_1680297 [Panus rudis PR-1116 ss-1]|nr:hypothetical protein K474DRAFT_1680297 [Panus rudis PR-1116 ss-1]